MLSLYIICRSSDNDVLDLPIAGVMVQHIMHVSLSTSLQSSIRKWVRMVYFCKFRPAIHMYIHGTSVHQRAKGKHLGIVWSGFCLQQKCCEWVKNRFYFYLQDVFFQHRLFAMLVGKTVPKGFPMFYTCKWLGWGYIGAKIIRRWGCAIGWGMAMCLCGCRNIIISSTSIASLLQLMKIVSCRSA